MKTGSMKMNEVEISFNIRMHLLEQNPAPGKDYCELFQKSYTPDDQNNIAVDRQIFAESWFGKKRDNKRWLE